MDLLSVAFRVCLLSGLPQTQKATHPSRDTSSVIPNCYSCFLLSLRLLCFPLYPFRSPSPIVIVGRCLTSRKARLQRSIIVVRSIPRLLLCESGLLHTKRRQATHSVGQCRSSLTSNTGPLASYPGGSLLLAYPATSGGSVGL